MNWAAKSDENRLEDVVEGILHKAHNSSERQCHYGLIITIIQRNGLCVCAQIAAQFFIFFQVNPKAFANKKPPDRWKKQKVMLKITVDPPLTGGQINTAFGYFKKMIEGAHRQPRAAPRLWCMCAFRELFLRGRQRAAKLKQSHRVIIFSPVCCGLVPNALSLLASSNKERQREKDKKEQAPRRTNTIQKKLMSPEPSFSAFVQSHYGEVQRWH